MREARSLLLVGRGYRAQQRPPQCDETWTTLACVNADPALIHLPNLKVWDCHEYENKYDVPVYDIRSDREKWMQHVHTHGQVFANQYCWMLADLSTYPIQFRSVTLFGFLLNDEEHQREIQYLTYHIGYLRAVGVTVVIEQPSQLLRPSVYGFTESLSEHVDKLGENVVE